MNKIHPYNKQESGLTEVEYPYPTEYESSFGEGYSDIVNHDEEQNLVRSVFTTLRRHWLLILSLNLIITAITIVYVAQKTSFYKAEARIQVNSEINPATGASNGGSPIVVSNSGADPAYFATQLQILEGAGLMRRVVKTLDLENNEEFLNPLKNKRLTVWENVKKLFGFYTPPEQDKEKILAQKKPEPLSLTNPDLTDTDSEVERLAPFVNRLKSGLTVNPVFDMRTSIKETRLIDIEFTHQDPIVAAKIANAIGDAYVLQNLEQKVQSNASAGDFLQKRVAELQSSIRRGEERLINYARTNRIIPPDSAQNTVIARLSNLNGQLGQAENERIAAQTAYQAALQNQMWSTSAENKDGQVVALETKLNDLRQKLAQLKTEYKDEWYEVVQTKEQIAKVESQIKPLRKRATDTQLGALKEKLFEATQREKLLKESFEQQRAEVVRQNEASINYKIIQQEIDTNKSLLDGLLQRSRANEVVLTGTPNNVLVLDRALTPDSPAGPERTRSIFLAFFASLGLGIGLAFVIDWFDDSIKYSDNIEGSLGLPLLSTIPLAPENFTQKLRSGKLTLRKKNKKRSYDLKGFKNPQFLESYMQLGTYLLLSSTTNQPKTVLVTSAEEGEGKTMTALNLATSLAKTKGKVLLIDGDLRCPRLHRIKGLSNKVGLTTLLAFNKVDAEMIEQIVQKDPECNLDLLTAGDNTISPSNLLSSNEMEQLLIELSNIYSYIIIDSPPVLYFADSAVISTLVDSVIIIARDGKTSKKSVLKAKHMLQKVGAKIIGVVLNGVPIKQTNYYNYTLYENEDFIPVDEGDDEILKLN
jgi:capsular exopolysaccharide synthesis family protein